MQKELICIVCPKGCSMKVMLSPENVIGESSVSGNLCKRGAAYAINECTNPVRTLTTTIRLAGGRQQLAPVKSSGPIPKGMLFDCMTVINSHTAVAPLKIGDIIIHNILGTGVDILSTSNMEAIASGNSCR